MRPRWTRWAGLIALGTSFAQAQVLVTPQELQASLLAPDVLAPKAAAAADAPRIELLRPSLNSANGATLSSPTAIELRFQATPGSQIRPDTFRVLYGRLRLDITARLLSVTRISAEGLQVREAQLPAGQHRLLLSVEDNQGRQGQTQVEFEIR